MTFYFTDLNRGYQNDTDEATAFVALGWRMETLASAFGCFFNILTQEVALDMDFFLLPDESMMMAGGYWQL